jgi:hypothetical protein
MEKTKPSHKRSSATLEFDFDSIVPLQSEIKDIISSIVHDDNNNNGIKIEKVKQPTIPNLEDKYIKIGHRLFTKTKTNFAYDNNNITNSNNINGFVFYSSNKECIICGEDINISDLPIAYFPKCKHIVHIKHRHKSILNGNCPQCSPMNTSNGIPTIKTPIKRRDISSTIIEDDSEDLSLSQISAIIGSINPLTINSAVINEEYIFKNNIKILKLHESGINIKQIYHKIGIKTWESLLTIGFSRETRELLRDENFLDTETLVSLYHINKNDLWETLGLSVVNLIEWGYTPKELSILGYDIDNMIEDNITKKEINLLITNTNAEPKDMKDYLKMEKKHLYRFNITKTDINKWKWKIPILQKVFGFNKEDSETFGIIHSNDKNIKNIVAKNHEKDFMELFE